jgi:glycosyltransferase involved in cell wall biosynthesis
VLDGKTGILVQPSDEAGFAHALLQLIQQPDDRRRLGSAARAWVERNFTIGPVARKYAAFYEQVLAA